ncbi:hypothetical protein GW860_02635 [bacterium]|nr:hypothetical protein [bacterium]NCP07785.1 hypothetical protein [bacterium]
MSEVSSGATLSLGVVSGAAILAMGVGNRWVEDKFSGQGEFSCTCMAISKS